MYRVMVVLTGSDDLKTVDVVRRNKNIIPYDGEVHSWDGACKARQEAMEFFPAVIIEVV